MYCMYVECIFYSHDCMYNLICRHDVREHGKVYLSNKVTCNVCLAKLKSVLKFARNYHNLKGIDIWVEHWINRFWLAQSVAKVSYKSRAVCWLRHRRLLKLGGRGERSVCDGLWLGWLWVWSCVLTEPQYIHHTRCGYAFSYYTQSLWSFKLITFFMSLWDT